MTHRDFVSAAAMTRALACMATAIAVGVASQASAQQQPAPKAPAAQKGPSQSAQKGQQKGPPAGGAQQQQPPQQQQQQAQGEQPKLNFSPWTKVCPKVEANAKRVCLTGKDGILETGQPVVAAVLIEPDGEPKKILRV